MYLVIYCSFIFSLCIFIFYFSSEILAKFSYSVNPRLNKVYVCMYVCERKQSFNLEKQYIGNVKLENSAFNLTHLVYN